MKTIFQKRAVITIILLVVLIIFTYIGINSDRADQTKDRVITGTGPDPIFDVVDPPNSPPECIFTNDLAQQGTAKFLVRDLGDGIYKVNILNSENADIVLPQFNTNTKNVAPKNIQITFTKINKDLTSQVTLEAFDMSLGRVECDTGAF